MPDKSNDSNNRDDCSRSRALTGSSLPQLAIERYDDLMSYGDRFQDWLHKEAERIEDGEPPYEIKLSTSQARWMVSCLSFMKTLPKYLQDQNSPVLTRSEAES